MNESLLRGGVWSAAPTPFTADFGIDRASVKRMVSHHLAQGVVGIMLAGTTGEGPWLGADQFERLTRAVVEDAAGRCCVALQVTDNSPQRVLDHIAKAQTWGVDLAVVAPPFLMMNATSQRLLRHYRETVRQSPLPIGFYDRGANSPYALSESHLGELLTEPNLRIVKDSSANRAFRPVYLRARTSRPGLILLNGDEFNCVEYLDAGYDGLLLGGGVFNARLAGRIVAAMQRGHRAEAERCQARMTNLMYRVYGGPKIECWLTGLKELLVQMGVFSTTANLLDYPLTDVCRREIADAVSGADGMEFQADLTPGPV
jgi:4-hydroxy-tetrahydrodipicolinate synthase